MKSHKKIFIGRNYSHPSSQQGQTLVDALISIGLLGMVILTVTQISSIGKSTTARTQLIGELTQLYALVANLASSEPTCRIAFGGPMDLMNPGVAPRLQPYNSPNLTLYHSENGSQQPKLRGALIGATWAIQPGVNLWQGVGGTAVPTDSTHFYNHLTITQMSLTPAPQPTPNPPSSSSFIAEFSMSVTPTMAGQIPFPRVIRGLFLTVTIDGANNIISCNAMQAPTAGGNLIPDCPANQAATSYNGTTVQCDWTSCPAGYIASESDGKLMCTPE